MSTKPANPCWAWIVWSCAALFYAYQFALRVAPSVMTQELMDAFAVSSAGLSAIVSSYYIGYAFFQIPAGVLLDAFGPRRMVLLSIALCFLGQAAFLVTSNTMIPTAGRFLVGVGSAFSFLGCIKIATAWFPENKLALVTGLSILVGTAGAVSGSGPVASLVGSLGWYTTTLVLTLLAGGLLLYNILFLREPQRATETKAPQTTASQVMQDLLSVVKNPQVWCVGLYGFLLYVPFAVFCDLWGVPFLVATYDMAAPDAGALASIVYVGLGLGAPLSASMLGVLGGYRRCFLLSIAGSIACFFGILMLPLTSSWVMSAGIMIILGLFLSLQTLAFSLIVSLNPLRLSATASGFHNMICMLSGVICQPLFGTILDILGGVSTPNYFTAMLMVPAALALALVSLPLIKDTYKAS